MKWGNAYRGEMLAAGRWLQQTFDNLWAAITGAWGKEHKEDDTHGHVHADTLQVGRISYATIFQPDTFTTTSQINNLNDARLRDAALFRFIGSGLTEYSLTGLQVPQDETGAILDGRVLVIENASQTAILVLEHQHTASAPANRFLIPWINETASSVLPRYFCPPGSLTTVIYNADEARWKIAGKHNDEILGYHEFGSNQDNLSFSGIRSSRIVRLVPTAAGLTISGISSADIIAPHRKTLINEGAYRCAILHMNTGSTAANRVQCPGGSMYYLNPRESVDIYFETDGTWHIALKADQWVDVAFNAANFGANGGGSWAVASGDVGTYAYQIDGNKMTLAFEILTSDVTSGPSVYLSLAVPAGRTIARNMRNTVIVFDAGTPTVGMAIANAGEAFIRIYKDITGAAAWTTTAADNTYVLGQLTFMVQTDCASVSENHTDVAHGDTAHADGGHADTTHVDAAHVDSHSDVGHADAAHGDVSHVDSHSDTAHTDTAHSDTAHGDGHSDEHADTPHSDVDHQDAHLDSGSEFNDGASHEDIHDDLHGDTPHTDASHEDSHGDTAHSDVSHVDVSHDDVAHVDSHSDTAHADGSHSDTAFQDSHSDTPHSDVAHVDASHSDTVHADSPFQDVGLHCDGTHADI